MLEPKPYQRKPFVIEAVQVTLENFAEVVKWCGGNLRKDELHRPYIKIEVRRAANTKQTMAYEGDWVLRATTGFRVYTDFAFHKSFEPTTEVFVDPYQQSQNVFERPDVDRKEVVENPVGDEKVVQPESVETVVQPAGPFTPKERHEKVTKDPSTSLSAGQLFRSPDELREAHRTGGPRTADEIQEYREEFKRLHGRYPGEDPSKVILGRFSEEGREAFRRLYGHYPEESIAEGRIFSDDSPVLQEELEMHHPMASDGRISTYLEDYRKEHGHYPGENVDGTDA
jgi:hypothetical protein